MKKILITGGCGFIGSHLAEYLVELGYNVKVFDRYNSENNWGWLEKSKIKKEIEVVLGDIRDFDSVLNASKGCNNILHLAALIGIPYSYISPLAYIKTNIEGTYNILECTKLGSFENTIITSTSEVYGSGISFPMNENHPIVGQSPYSASKIGADHISLSYSKSFNLPIKILRPFNTFGPRQSARAIIPTIFCQAYDNKTINVGNTHTIRDFTYVKDLCRAYEKLMKSKKKNSYGKVFNVGNNKEISINELILQIQKLSGTNKKVVRQKQRQRLNSSEVNKLRCDYSEFNNLTSWHPRYSLKSGLIEFNNWFMNYKDIYKPLIYNV